MNQLEIKIKTYHDAIEPIQMIRCNDFFLLPSRLILKIRVGNAHLTK